MKCFNCANLRLQASEAHSKQGVAVCVHNKDRYLSIKFDRDCKDYTRADEGVIIKRMAWFDQPKKIAR